MRIFGLAATSALLAVGATAVLTVAPDRGASTATLAEPSAAAAKPVAAKHKKAKPAKPKLTKAQRRARAAAVGTLRDQGYRPVTLRDYEPDHVLRVLIGRGEGGERAFFFAGSRFLGNDAAEDSDRLKVVRAGNKSVAVSYKLFKTGDRPCCPSGGSSRVLFRWDGKSLSPTTSIPPALSRRAPAQ